MWVDALLRNSTHTRLFSFDIQPVLFWNVVRAPYCTAAQESNPHSTTTPDHITYITTH